MSEKETVLLEKLKSEICSYLHGLESTFLPVKEFISTIDNSTLQELYVELGGHEDTYFTDNAALFRSFKTLLILLAINEEAVFIPLLQTDWTDHYLPICFQTCSPAFPLSLSSETKIEFEKAQWSFLSPEFTELGAHLDFNERIVLPYLEMREMAVKIGDYSDATVSRIKIHPLYQTIHHPNGTPDPKIALKRLPRDCIDLFDRERVALKHLHSLGEPRIISLLTSYSWRDGFHLMLPFADSTLESLWKNMDPSRSSIAIVLWALQQMSGLVECLSHIHHIVPISSNDADRPQSVIGILHGDISPENILVMPHTGSTKLSPEHAPGQLVFSDFGLSTIIYDTPSPKSVPFPGNRTFEAPEDRLRAQPGRASDVWSLGGVFLEFLVWLILGRRVLLEFFDDRCTPDPRYHGRVKSDFFYEYIVDMNGDVVGMEVKDVVKRYIRLVREDKDCIGVVHQVMDIVEGMIHVNPNNRLTAQVVAERFRDTIDVLVL